MDARGFREELLKLMVTHAADSYKETVRVAALIEDKAQKVAAVAGVFLAAGLGFVKAENLKAELAILAEYMPQQLSEEEVKAIVQQTIQQIGASSKADMGKVMTALMPQVKGRADGKLINQLVQQLLG